MFSLAGHFRVVEYPCGAFSNCLVFALHSPWCRPVFGSTAAQSLSPSVHAHCVQHLDGHEVTLERDRVTQPGYVLKVAGEGMPRRSFPSEFGDLYVEFAVGALRAVGA